MDGDILVIDRPATIAALREKHLALMQEWRTQAGDAQRLQRAAALRRAIRESGADIEAPAERDEAQGIVDYWASSIASLPGQTYPEMITIEAYEGVHARAAGESAAQTYAALANEEERRIARQVFEALLRKSANGIERCPPRESGMLRQSAGDPEQHDFDMVIARFVATGAIVKLPGQGEESARFQVADAKIVELWPELQRWLEEETGFYRNLADLVAAAERWQSLGYDSLQLLRGKALANIDQFRGETDLVNKYIDASQAARDSYTRQKWMMLGGALSLALIAAVGNGYLAWSLRAELEDAKRETKIEKDKRAIAEALFNRAKAAENLATADQKLAADTPVDQRLEQAEIPPPTTETTSALAQNRQLEGAIWLGTNELQQVRLENGGEVSDFGLARKGTRFRARAAIYLREAMPVSDANYASRPSKGIVPKGTLIELRGPPKSYQRSTGLQFWADVQIVPSVYIQYTGDNRRPVEELRRYLAARGFDVPQAERLGAAKGKSEVRYFNQSDQPIAAALIAALGNGPTPVLRHASCNSKTNATSRSFVLEVWFDPSATVRRGTRC